MKRAQGALEYLIIIAAVIGIAAVVVYTLSGVMSSKSSSVSISSCKQAATNCKASKLLSPNDPCIACASACKNQVTGVELFSGAATCCAAGESSKIYAGSLECVPPIPINLVINAPAAGVWTGASVLLTAATDVSATCYYGTASNPTTQMSNTGGISHGQSLTGLTEIGTTQYFVRCTAGATTEEKSVTWSVDTTPPSVSITSPLGGTVSGTTWPISASASDSRSGVGNVKLYINGFVPLGRVPDFASPYSFSWDTTTYNGTGARAVVHTLKVEATDNVGNSQFSSTVTVTVSNPCGGGSNKCSESCVFYDPLNQLCCHDTSWRWYSMVGACPV